jgi:hypothetical protein
MIVPRADSLTGELARELFLRYDDEDVNMADRESPAIVERLGTLTHSRFSGTSRRGADPSEAEIRSEES